MKLYIIAILLFAIPILCKLEIKKNHKLATVHFNKPQNSISIDGLPLYFGSGNEHRKQPVIFIPDLSFNHFLVGQKSSTGWGVDCEIDTSCQIEDTPFSQYYYNSKQLFVQKASVFLTLDDSTKLTDEEKPQSLVQFKLAIAGNSWMYSTWSVAGCSPKSHFLAYLRSLFQQKSSLIFVYHDKNKHKKYAVKDFKLNVYLNPFFEPTDLKTTIPISADQENWNFIASVEFLSDRFKISKGFVCLNSFAEELIQVIDPIGQCDALKRVVCSISDPAKCTRSIADFSKAPQLKFKIDNLEIVFESQDYLYLDGDKLNCSFGDLSDLKSLGVCSSDSEIAVGKAFLYKQPVVFNVDFDGKTSLLFLENFKEPDEEKSPIHWVFFLIACLIVLAFICLAVFYKSKTVEKDRYIGLKYQNI